MSEQFTDYDLPETAYTTFDAQSLKQLLIERLNNQGMFTDQIYEGSNMSSFIDVIAYSYHVLLFYLNRTATESVFTEATIYENVNKIVKLLNYNPLGYQTSSLAFKMYASSDLVPGTYTIPRYTYVNSNGVGYTTVTDISFTKLTTESEEISVVSDYHLLYQGTWVEAPVTEAIGNNFETLLLTTDEEETHIDHFNIHIYVKHMDDGKYYEYTETDSLYLNKSTDRVFEKRLNHDLSYEIKFGNNINGKKLKPGDQIQVYYLKSVGDRGRVGPNFLDKNKLVMMGTNVFTNIKNDVKSENLNFITFDNLETLSMTNDSSSTYSQEREDIDSIKEKAPVHHITRDRLVTTSDYQTYILKNFGRILSDVKVMSNKDFLDTHIKYLAEEIGILNPFTESRIMHNHLEVGSSYTASNVYVYAVPKIMNTSSIQPMATFLSPATRRLIETSIEDISMVGNEIVLMDAVYMAISPGLVASGENEDIEHINNTKIQIVKDLGSSRDDAAIVSECAEIIRKYFDNSNVTLGSNISLSDIGQQILNIQGIKEIHTKRTDTGQTVRGLSFTVWNPVYSQQDMDTTSQNIKLKDFQFPYLYDVTNLENKIEIL